MWNIGKTKLNGAQYIISYIILQLVNDFINGSN